MLGHCLRYYAFIIVVFSRAYSSSPLLYAQLPRYDDSDFLEIFMHSAHSNIQTLCIHHGLVQVQARNPLFREIVSLTCDFTNGRIALDLRLVSQSGLTVM